MVKEKFICPECGNRGYKRDMNCMTCDGHGNPLKVIEKKPAKKKLFSKKKKK